MPAPVAPEIGKHAACPGGAQLVGEAGGELGIGEIDLVERDQPRLVVERLAVGLELALDTCIASAGSGPAMSTRWISTRQRSIWPRKRSPMPGAFGGALDQPGMSASTNSRSRWRTTPSLGTSVVKA
jgi:hypothetical protein